MESHLNNTTSYSALKTMLASSAKNQQEVSAKLSQLTTTMSQVKFVDYSAHFVIKELSDAIEALISSFVLMSICLDDIVDGLSRKENEKERKENECP